MKYLPVGKLPPAIADRLVERAPILDERIIIGPGTGMDCAVLDIGNKYLVIKSDPITFASENIGWYSVQINVNDIVTTGATPKWMSATILLPENKTDEKLLSTITDQLYSACEQLGISFIGGHTEVTHNLDRPIIAATLLGEVAYDRLISPRGVQNNDHLLLVKSLAIETTAIIASDFPVECGKFLSPDEIQLAKNYLYNPGISIYRVAQLAAQFGGVHAMHDPTEGGLSAALWEMAIAANKKIVVEPNNVTISDLSRRICEHFKINYWETISSGALLMAVNPEKSRPLCEHLRLEGFPCSCIGKLLDGDPEVLINTDQELSLLVRPERDAISKLFS